MRGHGRGALIITALLLLFSSDTAFSHPHVFIQNTLRIVFDQEGLAGVQARWVFDEFFSSMIADEFDRNHNKILEQSEICAAKNSKFDKAKRNLAYKKETGTWKLSDAKSLTLREHV